MTPLDLKRMKLQLVQVAAARAELEFKIEERLEDIKRIQDAIDIQKQKEEELALKIESEENPDSAN